MRGSLGEPVAGVSRKPQACIPTSHLQWAAVPGLNHLATFSDQTSSPISPSSLLELQDFEPFRQYTVRPCVIMISDLSPLRA
jgi:hypothetical protein